jgi:hypothetical protein
MKEDKPSCSEMKLLVSTYIENQGVPIHSFMLLLVERWYVVQARGEHEVCGGEENMRYVVERGT